MLGLCYKDFLIMRKQIGYYSIFLGIYTVLVALGEFSVSILSGLTVLIGMMLPISSFSYDDMAHWDKYAAATPAGKRGLVAGKYLFAILCTLLGAALVLVLQVALALVGFAHTGPAELVLVVLICIGISLLINAILLPLMVKFGAEKSRIFLILIFAAVFGASALIGTLTEGLAPVPSIPLWLLQALPVAAALLVVGALILSYFIAQGLCAKKEL